MPSQPYTESGLKSMWAKNRARISKEYGMNIQWTYHDIKAKGISDYEGDKQEFSDHKQRLEMEKYNRKTAEVLAHDTEHRPLQSK
jgi:hypothetical protein